MTARAALEIAQDAQPLDLAARVVYIWEQIDICPFEDEGAWREALRITRSGHA